MLFVDMDGVVADFDKGYEIHFGEELPPRNRRVNWDDDHVMWRRIDGIPNFFRLLPPMPGVIKLWNYIEKYEPTFLTGVNPTRPDMRRQKEDWIHGLFGDHVKVITCRSRDKATYCRQGDTLIDDWEKYKDLWLAAGGQWITHTSVDQTIADLKSLGF